MRVTPEQCRGKWDKGYGQQVVNIHPQKMRVDAHHHVHHPVMERPVNCDQQKGYDVCGKIRQHTKDDRR